MSKITTSFTGNWEKSRLQAKELDGYRIDDTPIGIFLTNLDLQLYFRGHYGRNMRAIKNAETRVWGCASTELMKAKFRIMASAVCGADPVRVFRKYEMKALVKNRNLRIINNRPAQLFRDFYQLDPDESYRLFCLTELLEARKKAQMEKTVSAWTDYRERRKFFVLGQQYELAHAPAMSPDRKNEIKIAKGYLLAAYRLARVAGKRLSSKAAPKRSITVARGPK